MDRPLIIFKLEYTQTDGWGAISNFITKFAEKIPMDFNDVVIASSYVPGGKKIDDNFFLVKDSDKNRDSFREIKKPENIYAVREKYDYAFYISIAYKQLQDVVDLQSLYLIMDACSQCKIVALICGEQSDYHKTSHFFAFLTENKGPMYHDIFFKTDKVEHLQLAGIGVLGKFLPLVQVNAATEKTLRQHVNEILPTEAIEEYLNGKGENKDISRILSGALRKLSEYCRKLKHRKKPEQCDKLEQRDKREYAAGLGELNLLTFLLFCFSLEGNEEEFSDLGKFNEEMYRLSIWADGCIQLIENIVFHSHKGRGAFSFRILEGEADYIRLKYPQAENQGKWIEMMITDYPGKNRTLNIADKFRENLTDSDMRSKFDGLVPRDFFTFSENERIREAWEKYYSEKGNVIHHYGLKIFQNVVQNSNGHFIAQSFATHRPQKDELYYDNKCMTAFSVHTCLTGTGYSVLFPIKHETAAVKEKFDDYGIEDYEGKISAIDTLFQYKIFPKTLPVKIQAASPKEKADSIDRIAEDLCDLKELQMPEQEQATKAVISIYAEKLKGDMAEIIYKAIILAMLQHRDILHVVLYECQQDFVQMFLEASYFGWRNLREVLDYEGGKQIALYTAQYYEEIIIVPEDWNATLLMNWSSNFSRETRWKDYFEKWQHGGIPEKTTKTVPRYPFDILVNAEGQDTVFERYVKTVVDRNIQDQNLGCKIENTHMRLGSTIHVNHFYEAEVLFGNSLFVERFALLMIKRMMNPFEEKEKLPPFTASDKLTLYGYSNYSEQTVFCTMLFLHRILPGVDVDYCILERESEDRGFTHVDRLRYSTPFEGGEKGKEKRERHFQERKIACVIPIASSLKTNEKMIRLFLEENGRKCKASFWWNFELILVGSTEENIYWEKKEKRIFGKAGMEILPQPEFFVEVTLDYQEPLECPMCFPKHIIDEQPLIEVNAASTIPNQAFGLIDTEKSSCGINEQKLRDEEKKLEILKDLLFYCHLERNENHFLFYFQTERLIVQYPEKIRKWLLEEKNRIVVSKGDYVILFCPAHFSNAGFIEYVNSYVFGGAAVVIRDDVNKEYRCNFRTKFSNLRRFVEKITDYNKKNNKKVRQIRLFYVDDEIVTGHTFQRARSLVQSIMEDYADSATRKYAVFDGIFVLLDRNSRSSKWQYTGVNEEEHLHAFRTVHISSIRNHGDACVYCNLAYEAGTLKRSSVTREMEEYWGREEVKFSVKSLAEYLEKRKEAENDERAEKEMKEKDDRAYRRLLCTNNAMIFLNEKYHGNNTEEVRKQLLTLILEGSKIHGKEQREYFLSYCKVLSRPFRVFDKAVKEAVFDFLLVVCQSVLFGKSCKKVIESSEKKSYMKDLEIGELFEKIGKFVEDNYNSPKHRKDLIKVLLKQLTEMKSNFIMRKSNMEQIFEFSRQMDDTERENFIRYYRCLIKKLTGVSSDTSKSLWMDQMLKNDWAIDEDETLQDIYMENVWIYQDAFQKLNVRVKLPKEWKDPLKGKQEKMLRRDSEQFEKENYKGLIHLEEQEIRKWLTPYQFKDFISLLQLYGLCDEKKELTQDGKVFIAANFLLCRFISTDFKKGLSRTDSTDEGNLTKVDYISTCMKHIMKAKEIVIIMEFAAEYDLWESILIERYHALLLRISEEKPPERIAYEPKKEYIILGSSEEKRDGWTIRENEVVTAVQNFRRKEDWKKKGCIYNLKEGVFLWELGRDTEYPVYIYAKWQESDQKDTTGIDRLNRIRSVMQYYWQLNEAVFNRSNESFFYELAIQRKNNAIHTRLKAYSHTKYEIKLEQYKHMLTEEKYGFCYQSDLLMLLADLNVSEHYRKSLTRDYYIKSLDTSEQEWTSQRSFFEKQREFYIINCDSSEEIRLRVSTDVLFDGDLPLPEDERIIAIGTNTVRESFLLIYSLMVNAATENRGYTENGCVTVYCSRTPEGSLRICNQMGENGGEKTARQIMEELQYPPEEDTQGISLWSMSRYIKRITASILDQDLKKLEEESDPISVKKLARMRQQILVMLGEEFQMSVEKSELNEKSYFSVVVPILAEKFKKQRKEGQIE